MTYLRQVVQERASLSVHMNYAMTHRDDQICKCGSYFTAGNGYGTGKRDLGEGGVCKAGWKDRHTKKT